MYEYDSYNVPYHVHQSLRFKLYSHEYESTYDGCGGWSAVYFVFGTFLPFQIL